MKMKYLFALILSVVCLVIISRISAQIRRNKQQQYAANLNNKNLVFSKNGELAYSFEPEANTSDTDSPEWLGYTAKYTYNSDGLNERFNYPIDKPADTFRIITLGASYVFGLYVNTPENFSELLEEELNKFSCSDYKKIEVINLGFPAYDIRYSVERYIRKGQKYNPDLLLWLLYDDNFIRVNEYILPIEKKFEEEGVPVYNPANHTYERNRRAIMEFNSQYSLETILNYQRDSLSLLNKYYTGKLIIAYFPTMKKEYKNLINEFISTRKDITDYNEMTDVRNLSEYSFPDGHPNRKGHEIIEKDLFKVITGTVLSSCRIKEQMSS